MTQVLQTPSFKKVVKKLNAAQKKDLDIAIKRIIEQPEIGNRKRGDLAFLKVFKFKMAKRPMLLGYSFEEESIILELIALGSHENFYRDLKRII